MPRDSHHCKRFAGWQHSHFGTKVQCNVTSDLVAVNYLLSILTQRLSLAKFGLGFVGPALGFQSF